MNGQAVRVGDSVKILSVIFAEKYSSSKCWMNGTVAWIHPEERFCVVELPLRGGIVRECCYLDQLKKT